MEKNTTKSNEGALKSDQTTEIYKNPQRKERELKKAEDKLSHLKDQ